MGTCKTFTTDILSASSIDFQTTATQQRRENGNEQGTEEDALGGSAPATITFSAICTDAVEHKEWQISKSQDFSTVDYRFNEETIDYTFDEQGSYYVKFIGSNSDASCTNESEVYTVSIGESLLDCPNAFLLTQVLDTTMSGKCRISLSLSSNVGFSTAMAIK